MTDPVGKYGKRRLEILRSAAATFHRRGYHGASVDAIARALHMTKGNLYYYFKNKEDLLYVCHDYSLDLLLHLLKEANASPLPPAERLRQLLMDFVHIELDELHGTSLTLEIEALSPARRQKIIAKRDAFDRGVRALVQAGIDAQVFRRTDPKLITFAIMGAINWIPRWFDARGPADSDEIAQVFADYLLSGVLADGVPQPANHPAALDRGKNHSPARRASHRRESERPAPAGQS